MKDLGVDDNTVHTQALTVGFLIFLCQDIKACIGNFEAHSLILVKSFLNILAKPAVYLSLYNIFTIQSLAP